MDAEEHIWVGKAIMHLDMDAFFAAVEQLDHPEWRGKPVIVGGSPDGRGVVSTASYEAREFGVHSAMPSARAARLCPDAIWAPSRFDRYHELSQTVREILRGVSPHVQPVSVDEAFVDITPSKVRYRCPVDVAKETQERVAELGITCSIGLGTSKTVAKIASDYEKPQGLTVVWPGEEAAFLAPLPVGALSGIGSKSESRLARVGIRTLGRLATLEEEDAIAVFGSHGPQLVRRAQGIDPRAVHRNEAAKSVSNEQTFGEDVRDAQEIRAIITSLSERVGTRLRRKGMAGRTVNLKIRFADFTTKTAQRTLERVVCDDATITEVALTLLEGVWSEGVGVRLLGVGVSHFDDVGEQMDLLAKEEDQVTRKRSDALSEGLDAVRERFGSSAIARGMRRSTRPRR